MSLGNEPAFPIQFENGEFEKGMTKRELFAALAMQGMLSNLSEKTIDTINAIARKQDKGFESILAYGAIVHADALLAELEKGEGDDC